MYQNARNSKNRRVREPYRTRTGTRMLVACINCKERKLKCDDQVPACENCQRLNLTCLVEDPATKRRQPRNYLETLEEHIAFLEGILQQARPNLVDGNLQQGNLASFGEETPPVSTQPLNNASDGISDLSRSQEEHDPIGDLALKVGMLGLKANGAEPHYLGSSSAFAFSRVINSSLVEGLPTKPYETFGLNHDNASTQVPCLLPDYESAVMLSNAYFYNIHPQYPFLHEATFRVWEMELARPTEMMTSLGPIALFFLYMVYAVGALLLPRCGYSPEQLYISAQLYIDQVVPLDNLEAIQAILCCAMYSLRSVTGPSTWKLSGLALRQCVELGYHRNAKRFGHGTNPLRLELRKRAFWCAYAIDCAGAITLGRPLGIPYTEVDAEYPMDIEESCITHTGVSGMPRGSSSDPPSSMSVAIHVFQLRRLWAKIHTSLYSDTTISSPAHLTYHSHIENLRAELASWRASIPPLPLHIGEALSLFCTTDWFEVNYSFSILLLYRGQITESKGGTGVGDQIFLECLHAAEEICHRYRRQFIGRSVGYTWGALHFLFVAGLSYLHCLWTSPVVREVVRSDEVSSTCTDCTMVLVAIAERWKGAAPYRDIFEALAGRTMTMMVEKNQERWIWPDASVALDGLDPGDLSQWVTGIADTGMSDGVDKILAGFVGDLASTEQDTAPQ